MCIDECKGTFACDSKKKVVDARRWTTLSIYLCLSRIERKPIEIHQNTRRNGNSANSMRAFAESKPMEWEASVNSCMCIESEMKWSKMDEMKMEKEIKCNTVGFVFTKIRFLSWKRKCRPSNFWFIDERGRRMLDVSPCDANPLVRANT